MVFERLIAGHTELLVRLAVLVSERYGFAGSWRFGLLVVGLKDKGSALCHASGGRLLPAFFRQLHR
jgi:hypothetical protein